MEREGGRERERERETGSWLIRRSRMLIFPERRALVCDSRTRYVVHSGFLVGKVGSGRLITTAPYPQQKRSAMAPKHLKASSPSKASKARRTSEREAAYRTARGSRFPRFPLWSCVMCRTISLDSTLNWGPIIATQTCTAQTITTPKPSWNPCRNPRSHFARLTAL